MRLGTGILRANSAVLKVQIECTISGAVRFKGARDNELDANHKSLLKKSKNQSKSILMTSFLNYVDLNLEKFA